MKKLLYPLLILLLANCKDPEETALAILRKAQRLEAQGQEIEALKIYDTLMEHKDTNTFQVAKADL